MLDQGQSRTQAMLERIRVLDGHKRAQLFARLEQSGVKVARLPIVPASEQGPLPLSYAQQRQWFLWQLDPQGAGYNIALAMRLDGALDSARLEQAFDALSQRQASLRTTFEEHQGEVRQVLRPHLEGYFTQLELAPQQSLEACVRGLARQAFDLRRDPLLRVRLIRLEAQRHVLVVVLHHIIADGWSMNLLVREAMALYAGQGLQLRALPVQYSDYAAWQRQWLGAGELARQLDYWRGQLGGEQPVLELPADRPRAAMQSFRGGRLAFSLDEHLYAGLKRLADEHQATLFMVLLAALQALLYRYSGQPDVRVGIPVANRNREETEGLIGFFVNTQVMRAQLRGEMPFSELLRKVVEAAHDAQCHQDLPFEQLVEALQPERNLSVNPLFQVMFNHQVQVPGDTTVVPELSFEPLQWDGQETHFDLTLNTTEQGGRVEAELVYARDLFDAPRIERLATHWRNLLRSLVAQPGTPIAELGLLEPAERAAQQAWQGSDVAPAQGWAHQRIAAWAAHQPEALAVSCGAQRLSFAELECQANQLAHELMARGVRPEMRVAVVLERGVSMIVALLAVLKAGAAYVPIDPQYPRQRLEYLMADCGMSLLVSQASLLPGLPATGVQVLDIDALDLRSQPVTAPQVTLAAGNLAYVIYTSGSTGQPKGVMVSHGPLAMHCQAIGARYAMTPADCELHFMSFAFDGAHERWLTALGHGARLTLRDDSLWTPAQTYQHLHQHGVTVAAFPPAYLQQLAEHAERDGNPPPVRIYCFGGDAVAEASFELARRVLKPQAIINGYGPTETVVTPLIWKAGPEDRCGAAYAPIGSLVGARRGHLLDADLAPVPGGHAAELYLGGQGLARGYLGRPGLTAERFVPDPFQGSGQRLYRSGDQVRQREDGVIDYVGRVDHQVKIRGFRIELGEIEACLQAQEAVREAVVIARDGEAGKQLVAYVVPRQPGLDAQALVSLREQLKTQLKEALASFMVPAAWVVLERLPLTPNGKVDRKALPAPDPFTQQAYVAPQSELEQQLAAIWQQVLGTPQVSLLDNFFELGGHSLLATQVTAQVQLQLGINVPLEKLFLAASLQDYAGSVQNCENVNLQEDLGDMHDFLSELEAN